MSRPADAPGDGERALASAARANPQLPPSGAKTASALLALLVAGFVAVSLAGLIQKPLNELASDFACFRAGATAALHEPRRLYDFAYLTQLQGWPFGPTKLRPFIYPPSSLPLFIPFALGPYWIAYGLWTLTTGALFLWAGLKAGARWWFIVFPPVILAAYCGQTTLLMGGLAIGGLCLERTRPIAAGLLFGAAAAVKPQIVVLIPIALAAEGRWRTLAVAGATVGGLAALSVALWGAAPWLAWVSALQRFQGVIFDDVHMVRAAITPYAALRLLGVNAAWAFLLPPVAAAAVWLTFRRTQDIAARSLAIFVGALCVSPYAMNYEAALLAPAVATWLARVGDRRWLAYALASGLYFTPTLGVAAPLAAVALPAMRRVGAKSGAGR